jgi:hypothetical protein
MSDEAKYLFAEALQRASLSMQRLETAVREVSMSDNRIFYCRICCDVYSTAAAVQSHMESLHPDVYLLWRKAAALDWLESHGPDGDLYWVIDRWCFDRQEGTVWAETLLELAEKIRKAEQETS